MLIKGLRIKTVNAETGTKDVNYFNFNLGDRDKCRILQDLLTI